MSNNTGANPFDTADDVNPFGNEPASSGLEHYDPFAGDAKPPPRSTSPQQSNPVTLDFHDNQFNEPNAFQQQEQYEAPIGEGQMEGAEGDDTVVGLEEQEDDGDKPGMFSFAFYQALFNVDTINVLDRIFRSCVPFRRNFFEATSKNPDLYGTLWVSATLVFVLAAAGNFANYIRSLICHSTFTYDFNKLPYGALAVYLYIVLVPLILWGALAWIDDFKLSLVQAYCLYGYAMFIFIPAGIACVAPFTLPKYISIGIAFGISSLHLVLSLWPILSIRRFVQIVTVLLVVAAHFGISLSFALYFFNYKAVKCEAPKPPVAPPA